MGVLVGGIEGGSTSSRIVLVDENCNLLGSAEGPHTNQWLIGIAECVNRLITLVDKVLANAGLSPLTTLSHLGLALSGVDTVETQMEVLNALSNKRHDIAKHIQICNDSIGTLLTVTDDDGIVLISGTGSICNMVYRDLTFERVGGYGYLLGDGGSAYWIVQNTLQMFLRIYDGLMSWEHDIQQVQEIIYKFFSIEHPSGLLSHFYTNFSKGKVALLCKNLSDAARKGEPLCTHVFEKAGEELGHHTKAVLRRALSRTSSPVNNILVVCCGSVFKSWDLLRNGYHRILEEYNPTLNWKGTVKLVRLRTTAAFGAARYAVRVSDGIRMPLPPNTTTDLDSVNIPACSN
ncbi:unnamed protein product [Calicophoron daubneyi]|uniref:N-acetyl-D-glucosamine kinase n=1 Tax=Calicophoron daubneyi TaxID=300641 RepID=A0AAV2TSJ6_CALDB